MQPDLYQYQEHCHPRTRHIALDNAVTILDAFDRTVEPDVRCNPKLRDLDMRPML
jgi:hypothetical protein